MGSVERGTDGSGEMKHAGRAGDLPGDLGRKMVIRIHFS